MYPLVSGEAVFKAAVPDIRSLCTKIQITGIVGICCQCMDILNAKIFSLVVTFQSPVLNSKDIAVYRKGIYKSVNT